MSEWKECKLGDVAERITKGTTPTTLGLRFTGSGINFVKSESFGYDGRIDKTKFVFIHEETHTKLFRSQLKKNDVLFSMAGVYLGKTALVTNDILPANTNQAVGIIRLIQNKAHAQYVRQYLSQEAIIELINNFSGQSAQPNINLEEIGSIPILLPPLPEQHAIAGVLSSLDDKIDLLHQQNKTLEGMAETLWRKLFVEEADPNWKNGKLGSIVSVSTGKGLKKNEYVENGIYPVIGANGEIGRTNKYLTYEKVILTGRVGTLGEIQIHNEKIWISDNVLIVKSLENIYFYFVYFLLKGVDFENLNVGSTQPLVTQTDLKNIEIAFPQNAKLGYYTTWCESAFDKIEQNVIQIRTLLHLRDTLLPKLMSGEVRVKV